MLLSASPAQAHPGVGIVEDGRGNVFYTDLKQVWRIAPSGAKTVAVADVHTHELCLDADDNLYGEHLWYEGDATQKWRHRVWCLRAAGTLGDVIPARDGFLEDDSFVRDQAGNRYWAQRAEKNGEQKTVIQKRSASGEIGTHATGDFRDVRWMTARPDGTLDLIDSGDLVRISSEGKVTTVAERLSSHSTPPAAVATRHYHMGLWTDAADNVYVAVPAERLVLRVDKSGKSTVVARSTGDWSPSGGLLDRAGNLWLLEYSSTNAVRVRRINRDGQERIF